LYYDTIFRILTKVVYDNKTYVLFGLGSEFEGVNLIGKLGFLDEGMNDEKRMKNL